MRGRWSLLTAVVRGRRVRRSVRKQFQVCTSALLYPIMRLGAFSTTLESDVGHGAGRCVQPLDGLSLEEYPGWCWDFV